MRRGTTPTYTLAVAGYDLRDMTVYVTLQQDTRTPLTLTNEDLSIDFKEGSSILRFTLSQHQTLSLQKGIVHVQARFIDEYGTAYATSIEILQVLPILLEGEIEYES